MRQPRQPTRHEFAHRGVLLRLARYLLVRPHDLVVARVNLVCLGRLRWRLVDLFEVGFGRVLLYEARSRSVDRATVLACFQLVFKLACTLAPLDIGK